MSKTKEFLKVKQMKILRLFFYSYLFFSQIISAKVLLFTYAYNRPDFIEIQYKTFKKFLHDEYEFIVFNDAPGQNMCDKINNMCAKYGVRCVRIPQEIHDKPYLPRLARENFHAPAVRNCNVVQYSLDTIGFDHDDILVLLDSDMFLVKDFSVIKYMKNLDTAGLDQERKGFHYLWIGLVMLNMQTLPDKRTLTFNCGEIEGVPVDSGGQTYHYLKQNPKLKINYIDEKGPFHLRCNECKKLNILQCTHNRDVLLKNGFDQNIINCIQMYPLFTFFLNNSFLHYYAGTNWNGENKDRIVQKTNALYDYLNIVLKPEDHLENNFW